MKKDMLILAAAVLLAGVPMLHSQNATAKDPAQMLKTLKASNADLIDKQKKTLETLDDMAKQADQIRILAKKT